MMSNKKVKIKKMSKRKAIIAIVIAALLVPYMALHKSESFLRSRVVKLKSSEGSCSGEQIRAPSGADYILTAGHCAVLADAQGSITVEMENGKEIQRKIIAESGSADLLLLEGIPHMRGIDIASSANPGTEVRTFTHGSGYRTYKTTGELVQQRHIQMLLGMGECSSKAPKYKTEAIEIFGFQLKVCTLSVDLMMTTAMVVPGSSGGMVVNSSGDLAGVVSGGGDSFGGLVLAKDINEFVSGY